MDNHTMDIGVVGLGVMGRNFALNIADHGYAVAGYDKDPDRVQTFTREAGDRPVFGAPGWEEFTQALRVPRTLLILVPAGKIVDNVLHDALPHLEPGDLIIDGGNSYFHDTELRARTLAEKQIDFFGMGISGGEEGARHGPSMMPGGPKAAFARVQPILEAAAAKVDGDPCVAYLGPEAAGHYVKMVHNGIEYGLMQLIAETYDLMRRGLHLSDRELRAVYTRWNETALNGYLLEITADIFGEVDKQTGGRLIDEILDSAKQKGTGKWTAQDALELGVPTPTIDTAVVMRNLSALKDARETASQALSGPAHAYRGSQEEFIHRLQQALYAATILTFAQGMAQLHAASQAYDYDLDLATVARIWRGGCIIRTALLEEIRTAYRAEPQLANLLLHDHFRQAVTTAQADLRFVVQAGVEMGIPVGGLTASLAYFDAYRSDWLPANLIQAQRDYFGAHTYERVDEKGVFHTEWDHPAPVVKVR